jgi:hypothetical protein
MAPQRSEDGFVRMPQRLDDGRFGRRWSQNVFTRRRVQPIVRGTGGRGDGLAAGRIDGRGDAERLRGDPGSGTGVRTRVVMSA